MTIAVYVSVGVFASVSIIVRPHQGADMIMGVNARVVVSVDFIVVELTVHNGSPRQLVAIAGRDECESLTTTDALANNNNT